MSEGMKVLRSRWARSGEPASMNLTVPSTEAGFSSTSSSTAKKRHYEQEIKEWAGGSSGFPLTSINIIPTCMAPIIQNHPAYSIVHGHIGSSAAIYL